MLEVLLSEEVKEIRKMIGGDTLAIMYLKFKNVQNLKEKTIAEIAEITQETQHIVTTALKQLDEYFGEIKVKKPRIKKTEEEEKIQYTQFVSMKKTEIEKLYEDYGEKNTKKAIVFLNNYKGSSGKTYKSDYHAILSWVIERVKGGTKNELDGKITSENSTNEPTLPKNFYV